MNGNNILLDTNIILYLLSGEETLLPLLEEKNLYISFITQLELLSSGFLKPADVEIIKQFISECTIIDITPGIKEFTVNFRRKYNLKLPDSIILGTSVWLNMPLISADHDFAKVDDADIILFRK